MLGVPLSSFEGRSLYLFPTTHPLRRFCFSVVDDVRFDVFVLIVILLNCAVLAMQTPANGEHLVCVCGGGGGGVGGWVGGRAGGWGWRKG
jgi:hypothetical protein